MLGIELDVGNLNSGIVENLIKHVEIKRVENSDVLLADYLGLNVVCHLDLVGLGIEKLNYVCGKGSLTVSVHIELYLLGHVEWDERICQEIIGLEER